MANKSLFQTIRNSLRPAADTKNSVGGSAYKMDDKDALAQFIVTGCFNATFYQSAEDQLRKLLTLTGQIDSEFIAKAALYSRGKAYMKDAPALLCAVLASRDIELLKKVFHRVIDNGKMLRNFVQIMRSGVTGRKSMGTASKRLVQQWLNDCSDDALLSASIGASPSIADVIKMVHPKPSCKRREAFFGYLLGNDVDHALLPEKVKAYIAWKLNRSLNVPNVPFQLLTSQNLTSKDWKSIALSAPWQMTRMNLNTFQRNGVLNDKKVAKIVADRLRSANLVRKSRAFPYQLLAAYKNVEGVPSSVCNALQMAMEVAIENVPKLSGDIVICPDVSGSMHQSVTGYRQGASSKVNCIDVAALVAAAILRKNPDAKVLPFENDVVNVNLNPFDSVMTNALKLASLPCGGTNCSAPLKWINKHKLDVTMVIFVSDNESWIDSRCYGHFGGGATATMNEWNKIKQRCPKAKMACVDIVPNDSTQAKSREDILNVGGFSDQVFKVLAEFANGMLDHGGASSLIDQEII